MQKVLADLGDRGLMEEDWLTGDFGDQDAKDEYKVVILTIYTYTP